MQTIDGVLPTITEHEVLRRILVKSQTTTSQNGIYVMSAGEWERAKDFDGSNDFIRGTRVYVWGGSTNSGPWIVTSSMDPDTFVIETTAITFELIDTEIGEPGVTPTFANPTVTTLSSTASATVTLTETSTNVYRFDFGIPAGEDGADGAGTGTSVAAGFGMNFTTITTTGSVVLHAGYIVDVGNAI